MCTRKNKHFLAAGTVKKPFAPIWLAAAIVSALFGSCLADKVRNPGNDLPLTVKTARAEMKRLDNHLHSFGTVSYKIKNDISAMVNGTIIELNVKEGDPVRNGQLIARLRNVQLEIQKEQYENTLDSARAVLNMARTKLYESGLGVESRLLSLGKNELTLRQQQLELQDALESFSGKKELHALGGITDAAYKSMELAISGKQAGIDILKKEIEIARLGLRDQDLLNEGYRIASSADAKMRQLIELNTRTVAAEIESAAANVRNAEKSLDSIKKLLDEHNIRASVDGVVGALYFERGEYVPQNEKIATLMDISSVYAVFAIQEQDIINFKEGNPLEIEIPALGKNIRARIDEISPMADPETGNFSVKAEIGNKGLDIKPGMFIKCSIQRQDAPVCPVIPETALIKKDGRNGTVFCVVNNVAVLKTISIAGQKDGQVWAAEGIGEGDLVIDKAPPFLKEGSSVQIH